MSVAANGFNCLDVVEKQFDRALTDLDILFGGGFLDDSSEDTGKKADQCDVDDNFEKSLRLKLATLSICWSKLYHTLQTVCQHNAKLEAQLIVSRDELVKSLADRSAVEAENKQLLEQLHCVQLQLHRGSDNGGRAERADFSPENESIKKQLESVVSEDRRRSISLHRGPSQLLVVEKQLDHLRNGVLIELQSKLAAAKLSNKYTQHQLSGRVQQLQMLNHGVDTSLSEKIWRHIEAEIRVNQHKALALDFYLSSGISDEVDKDGDDGKISLDVSLSPCCVENVAVEKPEHQLLGISIIGGCDHGAAIYVSAVKRDGVLHGRLCVGDTLLSVNGVSLTQMTHSKAANFLKSVRNKVKLEVLHHLSYHHHHHLQTGNVGDGLSDQAVVDIRSFLLELFLLHCVQEPSSG